MQPALEDENFKEVSVFLGLGGNYLKRVYWSVLFSVLQARVLKSILAVRIHAMGTWRRQQQSQTMHGWRCKKDLLAVIDYRARRQEVAQERKRNESTTDLIALPGSACLLHSFSARYMCFIFTYRKTWDNSPPTVIILGLNGFLCVMTKVLMLNNESARAISVHPVFQSQADVRIQSLTM